MVTPPPAGNTRINNIISYIKDGSYPNIKQYMENINSELYKKVTNIISKIMEIQKIWHDNPIDKIHIISTYRSDLLQNKTYIDQIQKDMNKIIADKIIADKKIADDKIIAAKKIANDKIIAAKKIADDKIIAAKKIADKIIAEKKIIKV
jgi:hypothetical protein